MISLQNKFYEIIERRFCEWCEIHNTEPTPQAMLLFLMQKNFIPKEEVKIEVVVNEVNRISNDCKVSKTQAVRTIEAIYEVPESTCFYILDKHQLRHK